MEVVTNAAVYTCTVPGWSRNASPSIGLEERCVTMRMGIFMA